MDKKPKKTGFWLVDDGPRLTGEYVGGTVAGFGLCLIAMTVASAIRKSDWWFATALLGIGLTTVGACLATYSQRRHAAHGEEGRRVSEIVTKNAALVFACLSLIGSSGYVLWMTCRDGVERSVPVPGAWDGNPPSPNAPDGGGLASRAARVQYYGSFAGYNIPFVPVEPLTWEQAKSRVSYYVAVYDTDDGLLSFTKYLDGKMVFRDEYTYSAHGAPVKRKMTKLDGEIIEKPLSVGTAGKRKAR